MNVGKRAKFKNYTCIIIPFVCMFKGTDKKTVHRKTTEENKPNSKQWLVLEAGNTVGFCVLQIYSSKLIIRLTLQKASEVIAGKM